MWLKSRTAIEDPFKDIFPALNGKKNRKNDNFSQKRTSFKRGGVCNIKKDF